jgi:hypothetical protein
MGSNHFLVNKAFVYEKERELRDPEDCVYDTILGLWLWGPNKEILVNSDSPRRPRYGTKKNDVETGEDNKGE